MKPLYKLPLALIACLVCTTSVCALERQLTGLSTPETNPSRAEHLRSRLVDSDTRSIWKGKAGRSYITFDLQSPKRITRFALIAGKSLRLKEVKLMSSNSGSTFIEVKNWRKLALKKNEAFHFVGLDLTSRYLQLQIKTRKPKRKRLRGKFVPKLSEISLYETIDLGSGAPTPTVSTTPVSTATPSPSGTPTASPSSSPTPVPTASFVDTDVISLNSSGQQGSNDAHHPSISDDGRYVVFDIVMKDFEAGIASNARGVFLRDQTNGTTVLLSKTAAGLPQWGEHASISGDGRYVAFHSNSNKLVTGDSNGNIFDIIVLDRKSNTFELASISSAGVQSNASCRNPFLSGSGRYVAFVCFDTNLVPGDNNNFLDVYVRDRTLGTTTLVSKNAAGVLGNSDAHFPSISDDGRYVVWDSRSDNLIANDTNQTADVFIHDLVNATTDLVSINVMGLQANDESDTAHISGDGNYIVFQSFATNLVAGTQDRNIFLHNRVTSENQLVSATPAGQATALNFYPSVSDNGRYVAFNSGTDGLEALDGNGFMDVYLHDSATRQTLLMSRTSAGLIGNGDSVDSMGGFKSISGDGKHVAFQTGADNLFGNDLNGRLDIVVSSINPGV